MFKSDSIAALADALSKAQDEMKNAIKDSNNPFFKSKYADLASVTDACRHELAKNGLAVVQLPSVRDGKVVLEYCLLHASGEFIGSELEMTPVKSDPQGIGSAITYARRYSLAGIAGVATEDDDGNAASGNTESARKARTTTEDIEIKPKKSSAVGTMSASSPGGVSPQEEEGTPLAAEKNSAAGIGPDGTPQLRSRPKPEDPPAVEYIAIGQQKNFHKECRAAVPPARSFDADNLVYAWLADNGFKDEDGLPTASKIPAAGWLKTRERAIEWLKQQ